MKSISGSRKGHCINRLVVFLLLVALIAGMAACDNGDNGDNGDVEISDWTGLNDIKSNLSGSYRLMNDLSKETGDYYLAGPGANGVEGWAPIGTSGDPFRGTFHGNGKTIKDLYVNRPNEDNVGLFGYVLGGDITDIDLADVDVTGKEDVGGVVGHNRGVLAYSSCAGIVKGTNYVGGLAGYTWGGTVHHSESWVTVLSQSRAAGGLVGYNSLDGEILFSYYRGVSVQGETEVGGLAGLNNGKVRWSQQASTACIVTGAGDLVGGAVGLNNGTVERSSNLGLVVCGNGKTGGLVGSNGLTGKVTGCGNGADVNGNCHGGSPLGLNCGTVSRTLSGDDSLDGSDVGGLVGFNEGIVSDSYSTGSVIGVAYVGGLIGDNKGSVDSSYSSGGVTGDEYVGGLVGWSDDSTGTVTRSLWDTTRSGVAARDTDWGIGGTTSDLTTIETYKALGWDICAVAPGEVDTACTWNIAPGAYPFLSGKETEPEPPGPEERTTGPFLDEVLVTREPSTSAAIQQLKTDAMDLYAFGLADAALFQEVVTDPGLKYTQSLGSYNEFTFNPSGPLFTGTGKLNPFAVPELREAMNWLVSREYIVGEIMGGLGNPRYFCFSTAGGDYLTKFSAECAALEAEYAYNLPKATAAITTAMEGMGATLEGGMWMYGGEQVEIIILIKIEDERKDMGDYLASQLEDQGFKVIRTYGPSRDLAPIWLGDPSLGLWHAYTGGWVTTRIPCSEGDNFPFFYTNLAAYMGPLWQAYENDPVFYEAAEKLESGNFATVDEYKALFKTCLLLSMKDNVRMFLCDRASFTPMQVDVQVAADAYGGVYGSWMWAQTAHFTDSAGEPIVGGTMRIATTDILTNPWNPVAGTNWVYDMFPIRATGDNAAHYDTRTFQRWPGRAVKAEVVAQTGTPTGLASGSASWITLTFAPTISVPADAWGGWNAATQTFTPAGAGKTAICKSVTYYPKDIFEVPLHDGSTLSAGDFVLGLILTFDRGEPASDIYDEGYVAAYTSFLGYYVGVKLITDDPDYGLIVEYYHDYTSLCAEDMVFTLWPNYAQGPGMWHNIALGIRAEADNQLAFSQTKSTSLDVEWTSFIAGPSIPILKGHLDTSTATNYIPYRATMGNFVTEAEAVERWSNLSDFYDTYGHFWVASGPFFLKKAFTTEKVIQLQRFEDYPDPMDRWLFLLEPLS
jgi:peptide/nickel transport system substrate-binding protein